MIDFEKYQIAIEESFEDPVPSKVQKDGKRAIEILISIHKKYDVLIDKAVSNNEWDLADKYDRESQEMIYKNVIGFLEKKGYKEPSYGGGSNGSKISFYPAKPPHLKPGDIYDWVYIINDREKIVYKQEF